jgi:simple sugar transport system ATP-binding protein
MALFEAVRVGKMYGSVIALKEVDLRIEAGKVTCLLGDNGAGKSTLIQILAGVFPPDAGHLRIDGDMVRLQSPVHALNRGIATVYQDLAVVPIMPAFRNFFLGREPTRGWGPLRFLDIGRAKSMTEESLRTMGIDLGDVTRPIMTLSGGQRQVVAIARAIHFGAKVLILDEPTSALGVHQSAIVLDFIKVAASRGVGILLVTHQVQHAYSVGNYFTVLVQGAVAGTFEKKELSFDRLAELMTGSIGREKGEASAAKN